MKQSVMLLYAWLVVSIQVAYGADTLRYVDFNNIVINNYPLIKKADLYNDIAEAYRINGQGALDPKLLSSYDGKEFKDINYFSRWFSEVKIPTRLPIDFSLGYENNNGAFLNNESSLPQNGLIYGTLNISLIRGLLFDEQRFKLQSAELKGIKSEIERELLIRQILVSANLAYIDWAIAHENYNRYSFFQEIINDRHQNIIELYINGDKPAIDTIESLVNLNTATKLKLEAENNLIAKVQKLNLFLWDQLGDPLVLSDSILPQDIDDIIAILQENTELINPNFSEDPIIRKKSNEVASIELQNRLERENLKPQLDLKFNSIYNLGDENTAQSYHLNDYKVGATLAIPIRNRKTQGAIQLNEALQEQVRQEQLYYTNQLSNDYLRLLKNEKISEGLISNALLKIKNSQLLYSAEQTKFNLGESSVFLLNQRERKLLEAQIETIKAQKQLSYILNELYYLKLGQQTP